MGDGNGDGSGWWLYHWPERSCSDGSRPAERPERLHRPIVQKVTRASGRKRKRSAGFVLSYGASVASEKLDPHGLIGGFDRMTIVCVQGDLDELAGLP